MATLHQWINKLAGGEEVEAVSHEGQEHYALTKSWIVCVTPGAAYRVPRKEAECAD